MRFFTPLRSVQNDMNEDGVQDDMSEGHTKKVITELTEQQIADLERLRNMSDDEIDTSDMPVVLDWKNARSGMFYRPVKKQITLRVDAGVVAWFKDHAGENGGGYHTAINSALREHVVRTEREKAV